MNFLNYGIKKFLPENTKIPKGFKNVAFIQENLISIIKKNTSFLNGRFPIGFWNYTNLNQHKKIYKISEIENWENAGFTIVHGPEFDPYVINQKKFILKILDWCHKRKIKMIIWDPRCIIKKEKEKDEEYEKKVKEAISDFKNHPALFGFFIYDEPDHEIIDEVCNKVKIHKKIAPELTPFVNLLPFFSGVEERIGTNNWEEFLINYIKKSNTDLLSYDCYFQMEPGENGINTYFENLRIYRKISLNHGIPFWTTLLCVGHFNYRCPNFDDLRWQFNTALCCGANGILWFFYYMRHPHQNYRFSPVNELWELTETYYNLRLIHKNFHRHYGNLFTKLVSRKVSFYSKIYGGGEKFEPQNSFISQIITVPENHPLLIGEFTDIMGRPYVMIVNNSLRENVYATITFHGEKTRIFSWNWNGEEFEGPAYSSMGRITRTREGVRISHYLAPGQEAVYRIEA